MKVRKINFIGFIEGNTGYSVLSRSLISLMDYNGLDIRVQNLHNRGIPEFQALQNKDPKDRFQLLHQIPTVQPQADGFYTVTEFDQPPYGSISPIRRAKLILTESEFCKQIFEEFTNAEIHVIHYPIHEQYKPTGIKYKFNEKLEKFRFKFLSVFEWVMRKNPQTLIKAFVEEFSPNEDCCLILRCWSKFDNPKKWIGKLAKGHNVFWLIENVPFLAPLYRACDCFVTSTLGEGFGHPIAEAMACGLKVIVPKSTGIVEYCNTKNSILVPTKEVEIGSRPNELPHLIKPWFKCWEPDFEELKTAMRRAYKNEMKFIRANAVKVKDRFNYDNIAKEIKVAFDIE